MKGATEDEIVGWHHRLNGHEFEQAPGDSEGQGGLVCCSPRGCKELDMTERCNLTNKEFSHYKISSAILLFLAHTSPGSSEFCIILNSILAANSIL